VGTGERAIEIILARALMSHLATPAFLIDATGTLVFFNDAAAQLLGLRYEEAGPLTFGEWANCFTPCEQGDPDIPARELPLMIALNEQRPNHRRLRLRAMGGGEYEIEVSALPIVGAAGVRGAMALFWRTS
jgi:PAS domain-containing protein